MLSCIVTSPPQKMFSSSRGGGGHGRGGGSGGANAAAKLLENNSMACHYDVGKAIGSGGPEGVWKLYEARARSDGKVRRSPEQRIRLLLMETRAMENSEDPHFLFSFVYQAQLSKCRQPQLWQN